MGSQIADRGRQRPAADDPERLEALRDELREVVREAHGALKDIRAAIRDWKQATTDTERAAVELFADIIGGAMAEYHAETHAMRDRFQHTLDVAAADINHRVEEARQHILDQLTLSSLELDPTGQWLNIRWKDNARLDENPTGRIPDDPKPPA